MINLRKIEPADLPYLYQWENDYAAWADGSTHNLLSKDDLRRYIESTTGDIYADGQLRLIIEQKNTDVSTVGCLDLYDFDARNRRAGIGIYVSPAFRRQGIATKALQLLDDYAFRFLQLRLLYALVVVSNAASLSLFRSAGYSPSSPLPFWTLENDAVVCCKTMLH
jgi:diamine N-acetyltransferase